MWTKIITIKRTKDLNYFSLCALNLQNTYLILIIYIQFNVLFNGIILNVYELKASVLHDNSQIL